MTTSLTWLKTWGILSSTAPKSWASCSSMASGAMSSGPSSCGSCLITNSPTWPTEKVVAIASWRPPPGSSAAPLFSSIVGARYRSRGPRPPSRPPRQPSVTLAARGGPRRSKEPWRVGRAGTTPGAGFTANARDCFQALVARRQLTMAPRRHKRTCCARSRGTAVRAMPDALQLTISEATLPPSPPQPSRDARPRPLALSPSLARSIARSLAPSLETSTVLEMRAGTCAALLRRVRSQ
jgi:hypothetical protein